MSTSSMAISSIALGTRHRKDMGDLNELAQSIKEEGLLQPIGVTPENTLVFGARRLVAIRDILGWKEIDVRVVNVSSIVAGEYAENEVRKEFTLSERDAIRRAIKEKIEERRGGDHSKPANWPVCSNQPSNGEETRDFVARKAGFTSTTESRRVAQVVDSGDKELIAAMDDGDISVSAAANIAVLPEEERIKALEEKKGGKQEGNNGVQRNKREAHTQDAEPSDHQPKRNGRLPVGVEKAHLAINILKEIPQDDPLRKRGFQIVTDWMKKNR